MKKARRAFEGAAVEAAFILAALIVACGAILFAAAGFAMWLSTVMPAHFAMILTAAMIALVAVIIFLAGHHMEAPEPEPEEEPDDSSPMKGVMKTVGSLGGSADVIAANLMARQFNRAPVSALAATVALGALLGMASSHSDDADDS
ncbi:hypothetical protein PUV54_05715 [Hyphococcus flavus]|uniref:Uncharacterized protein n=1 Tax=Hyphococcus flavus TaxID=1866326 RepID=A0AAE9ZCZ4_9PROT|nr:hypothetical protein [Hyphococcus flavus]WDI32693.1 hypothetical protein PUV54_05715 [Hyphococcus flavus]